MDIVSSSSSSKQPNTLQNELITRDFAYQPDDPRYKGKYKEIPKSANDAEDGSGSDPWESFESGGPSIYIDDAGSSSILGKARALYDFEAENPTELAFAENDILCITYKQCEGWLVGYKDNQVGLIPENYVELLKYSSGNATNE